MNGKTQNYVIPLYLTMLNLIFFKNKNAKFLSILGFINFLIFLYVFQGEFHLRV